MTIRCIWDAKAELGEGALWHAGEQALYWVDIFKSELHRYAQDGETETWSFPGSISSIVPARSGGFLATFDYGIAHIDLEQKKVTPLLGLEEDLPENRMNDGCCDADGNFWFGSMDTKQRDRSGSFYRLGADGIAQKIASTGPFCITNGPTFSEDGRWVFLTDTVERRIYRASLDAEADPADAEIFVETDPALGYPDGMCMDRDGGLWVCFFGGAKVVRFDSNGIAGEVIEVPAPNITKCAFGGPDMRTLFITTASAAMSNEQLDTYPLAGGLFTARVEHEGFCFPPAVCSVS